MDFILQCALFLLGIVLLCYLPLEALFLNAHISLSGWRRVTLFIVFGITFHTFITYSLALIGLRNLGAVVLGLLSCVSLIRIRTWWGKLVQDWKAPHVSLCVLAFIFSLSVILSGWIGPSGMALGSVNATDGIWNVALIQELKHHFPPEHPGIAGVSLRGYHMFYNLWVAELSRLTGADVIHLHFHLVPVLFSLILIYGIYELSLRLSKSPQAAMWSTFMAIFGGSFSFVINLFFNIGVSADDAFGVLQPISLLVSPSFVSSLFVIIFCFIAIEQYIKKPSWILGIILAVASGTVVGFKVYAGMILLPSMLAIGLYLFIKERRKDVLLILCLSTVIAAIVFYPLNGSYGSLTYYPLWPQHRVMQGPLNFTLWELKYQTLSQMNRPLGILKLEIIALILFVVGNLGSRIIGVFGINLRFLSKISYLSIGIFILIVVSTFFPMFFIQPIGAFNMIQFFWYTLIFCGVFSGWGIYEFLERFDRLKKLIIAICILGITIPSAVEKISQYIVRGSPSVSARELKRYQYLRGLGSQDDVVLIIPRLENYEVKSIDQILSVDPISIRIPAFAAKRLFVADEVVQFPYREWFPSRVDLLSRFMRPQEQDEGLWKYDVAMAEETIRLLYEKHRVRFIVTDLKKPWFANDQWVHQLYSDEDYIIFEIYPQFI